MVPHDSGPSLKGKPREEQWAAMGSKSYLHFVDLFVLSVWPA